ncbi:MAG: cation:proton antiporter [Nitrosarchaeum sp.]
MVFEAILYLAVLIIAAKLFGEFMHRINQPTIIGNVLAGVIVGPALFALVEPINAIELFTSIGVFFLFLWCARSIDVLCLKRRMDVFRENN